MNRTHLNALLGLVIAVALCCGCSSKTIEWKEDVQLLDGSVIRVTQARRYERVFTGSGYGEVPRESWLTFALPGASSSVTWHEALHPMVLNTYGGRVYVVGRPVTAREAERYGALQTPYVGFVLAEGKWVRIPFEEIPKPIYGVNLRISNQSPSEAIVTLDSKRVEMRDPELLPQLKVIDSRVKFN